MSPRQLVIRAACTALLCCMSAFSAGAAGPRRADLPINVSAASSVFDQRNNTLLFREVIITQGEVEVRADEATATGLDFENSEWVFRGNVRMKVDGGSLASDEAHVRFSDNRIARATITGSPASFEQKLENGEPASGRAGTIEYDFSDSTVRMRRDAFLTYGKNNISGETLVYSIPDQRVVANAEEQGDQRVRFTINPGSLEQAQKDQAQREKEKEKEKEKEQGQPPPQGQSPPQGQAPPPAQPPPQAPQGAQPSEGNQ